MSAAKPAFRACTWTAMERLGVALEPSGTRFGPLHKPLETVLTGTQHLKPC